MAIELGDANETAARAPALVHVNWREVILFALPAYGLAWAWSSFFLLHYLGDLLTQSTTPTDLVDRLGAGVTLPTMLTPMIAALIMRFFVSREGDFSIGSTASHRSFTSVLACDALLLVWAE
jgi:hypothetical protein